MKKTINIISIVASFLFIFWFISEPSFEPAIGILCSISSLLGIYFIDRKKEIKKHIYNLNIRGYNENELKIFINKLTIEFFEISSYRYEMVDGEWYDIHFESKAKLNHEKIYKFAKEIAGQNGCKVYEIKGEGKRFGLINDEGSAQYY